MTVCVNRAGRSQTVTAMKRRVGFSRQAASLLAGIDDEDSFHFVTAVVTEYPTDKLCEWPQVDRMIH